MARPSVLFLCTRNAGRSQMAAALLESIAGDRIRVASGGTTPAEEIHQGVAEAMAERGLPLGDRRPRRFTDTDVREADVVVTMGCGDACPVYPGRRYEDWPVPDPVGRDLAEIRAIRDDLERRVRHLAATLLAPADHAGP